MSWSWGTSWAARLAVLRLSGRPSSSRKSGPLHGRRPSPASGGPCPHQAGSCGAPSISPYRRPPLPSQRRRPGRRGRGHRRPGGRCRASGPRARAGRREGSPTVRRWGRRVRRSGVRGRADWRGPARPRPRCRAWRRFRRRGRPGRGAARTRRARAGLTFQRVAQSRAVMCGMASPSGSDDDPILPHRVCGSIGRGWDRRLNSPICRRIDQR